MKAQKSKMASAFLLGALAAASAASDLDTASIDSIAREADTRAPDLGGKPLSARWRLEDRSGLIVARVES